MEIRNKRPYDVILADVGGVAAGAPVEVPNDLGSELCKEQPENWERVKSPKKSTDKSTEKEN